MLEIYTLTKDNIKEVAKLTGRRERDLALLYEDNYAEGKVARVYVDKPDIPEGFMRTN